MVLVTIWHRCRRLFRHLDDLEETRKSEAIFHGEEYEPLFMREFQWDNWAAPKLENGQPDISAQNDRRWPYWICKSETLSVLKIVQNTENDPKSPIYKIGEIFGEVTNKM